MRQSFLASEISLPETAPATNSLIDTTHTEGSSSYQPRIRRREFFVLCVAILGDIAGTLLDHQHDAGARQKPVFMQALDHARFAPLHSLSEVFQVPPFLVSFALRSHVDAGFLLQSDMPRATLVVNNLPCFRLRPGPSRERCWAFEAP